MFAQPNLRVLITVFATVAIGATGCGKKTAGSPARRLRAPKFCGHCAEPPRDCQGEARARGGPLEAVRGLLGSPGDGPAIGCRWVGAGVAYAS